MPRPPSPLPQRLAHDILDRIEQLGLDTGDTVSEIGLAEAFGVSRSPVRRALELLSEEDVVALRPHRGFVLTAGSAGIATARGRIAVPEDEAPYLRIARDRLAGALPEQFRETDLARRYGLARGRLAAILTRMAREGWIERRPGYGWSFVETMTTPEAHHLSYRFRRVIEPAALTEPGYRIDPDAFARRRAEQQALIDGRIRSISSAELFRLGSSLHETIVAGSGNPYFLESLRRINRQRRLIEYRAMIDTARFVEQAREHLRLLDEIEGGDRARAAASLSEHLTEVEAVKLDGLDGNRHSRPAELHF